MLNIAKIYIPCIKEAMDEKDNGLPVIKISGLGAKPVTTTNEGGSTKDKDKNGKEEVIIVNS
jgi:hypothetical protein